VCDSASCCDRATDDFRPLQAHFRKRSSAEQSLMSFRLGSNDDDLVEEEEEEAAADFDERRGGGVVDGESAAAAGERGASAADGAGAGRGETGDRATAAAGGGASPAGAASDRAGPAETERKPRGGGGPTMRDQHTDDSDVERRVAKLRENSLISLPYQTCYLL